MKFIDEFMYSLFKNALFLCFHLVNSLSSGKSLISRCRPVYGVAIHHIGQIHITCVILCFRDFFHSRTVMSENN